MMEFALKNITRQKSRTVLTTLGIVIGIAAVVTLGSFAEGINSFFQANLETSTGKIVVMQAGAGGFMQGFQGAAITKEQVDSLLNVDGVEDAVPVNIYFKASGFGPEYVVVGLDADKGSMIAGNDVSIYKGRCSTTHLASRS